MKALIFGVGIIGKRHAGFLSKNFGIESYSFCSRHTDPFIKKNIESMEEAKALRPDFVLITNATYKHLNTLEQCLELDCPVFLEKPIDFKDTRLNEIISLVKRKNTTVYVAYCLRFNAVIEYMKKYLSGKRPEFISIVHSNNLGNWSSTGTRSYTREYSQGGGIVLDMSHEIDYLDHLSPIKAIRSKHSGKAGNLTNDAPDFLLADIETEQCTASLNLSFHSHLRERRIKFDFSDHTVCGDIMNFKIEIYRKLELSETIQLTGTYNDMYLKQWKYFLDNLNNPLLMNNLGEASGVFQWMLKLNERS